MKILFDLDETLVEGDIVKLASTKLFIEKKLDRIYTGQDITNPNLDPLPNNLKILIRHYFADPFVNYHKRPIIGTDILIYYLISRGHEVSILTARPKTTHGGTLSFVHDHYNSIFTPRKINSPIKTYFSNNDNSCDEHTHISKENLLNELRPDFFFDDRSEHCLEAIDIVPNVFIIKNKYTGWNRDFKHDKVQELKSVIHFNVRRYGL